MERPEPPSSKVRIAVRVRPAPPDSTGAECITCLDDGRTLNLNAGSGSAVRPRSFGFDTVLGGDTTQEEFFHGCGVTGMLDAVLDGYTATVFAYGQTGSGKTFSMEGAKDDSGVYTSRGLIPRLFDRIFELFGGDGTIKECFGAPCSLQPVACSLKLVARSSQLVTRDSYLCRSSR